MYAVTLCLVLELPKHFESSLAVERKCNDFIACLTSCF